MRIARSIAALLGLATIGFAAGDFASHPNVLGALGLVGLVAVVAFLLSYIYRPRGPGERPPSEPVPDRTRERERERKRPRATETVWAGWDADEAKAARERRRPR